MRSSNRFGKWLFLPGSFLVAVTGLVLLLAAMPAGTSASALAGTIIWFDAPDEEFQIDTVITVTVSLSDVVDLYGLGLEVSYPADKLEVVDTDLARTGVQSIPADCPASDVPSGFVVENQANNSTGVLGYAVFQLAPTPAVSGDCQVLHIQFRTLQGPSALLHFNWVTMSNLDLEEIEATAVDRELAINTPPSAVDDVYTTTEETPLTVPAGEGLLANDQDLDGDALSIDSHVPPASGLLSLNSNGSFVYTPAAGFTGEVTFTYLANDGQTSSNQAMVTINVLEGDYYIYLPTIIR